MVPTLEWRSHGPTESGIGSARPQGAARLRCSLRILGGSPVTTADPVPQRSGSLGRENAYKPAPRCGPISDPGLMIGRSNGDKAVRILGDVVMMGRNATPFGVGVSCVFGGW